MMQCSTHHWRTTTRLAGPADRFRVEPEAPVQVALEDAASRLEFTAVLGKHLIGSGTRESI